LGRGTYRCILIVATTSCAESTTSIRSASVAARIKTLGAKFAIGKQSKRGNS